MKIRLLAAAIILVFSAPPVKSQVTENVQFDSYVSPTNNDLTNHFYGILQGLVAVPIGGITGGCLQSPDSNNWGNDNSRYCSKILSTPDFTSVITMCFKYDSTMVMPGFGERAASIWMVPHTDPNHYAVFSVTNQKKIAILTYGAFSESSVMNLQHDHWYQFFATYLPDVAVNGQMLLLGELMDLGTSGTAPPILVTSQYQITNDTILYNDDAIEVSITGARKGGGAYIDNFEFQSFKSADSCLTSEVNDILNDEFKIYLQMDKLIISGNNILYRNCFMSDAVGCIVKKSVLDSENSIDVSDLRDGVYCVSFVQDGFTISKKILLIK